MEWLKLENNTFSSDVLISFSFKKKKKIFLSYRLKIATFQDVVHTITWRDGQNLHLIILCVTGLKWSISTWSEQGFLHLLYSKNFISFYVV